jgi:dipeptidyl aminopeptidase/acylaminoacyl peptidase
VLASHPVEIIGQTVLIPDERRRVGLGCVEETGNVDAFDGLLRRLVDLDAQVRQTEAAGCGSAIGGFARVAEPDGRFIAFDSRANDPAKAGNPNVWIINSEGGQPRRLTTDPAGGVAPSWSHDGRWIYFASTRTGNLQIWKMPAAGGPAVQVTRKGGFEGFETADGRYLYYLKGREIPGIWRVPSGGGEETSVTEHAQAGLWRSWRLAATGIYYATAASPDGPRLEFMDLATGNVREIDRTIRPPDATIPSLAVSPDGRSLLYAQYDQSGSNIMMVEYFR